MARKAAKVGNKLVAIGYVRVSTDDQALGPEAQRAAIERWCASQGVRLAEVCDDIGVSGGAPLDKRPGMLDAMRALDTHGAGLLVVAKRDRLARDVVIAAAIESLAGAKGARIMSADGTSSSDGPEGMLMRGLVDLFAQYERALIRSRTKAALAVKRGRGERTGTVPLGSRVLRDGKTLAADEAETAALARVRELRATGHSLRRVAAILNAELVPARGKRWHPTTIARLVERAAGEP